MNTADDVITTLGLLPHPEGGHYKEAFRAPSHVVGSRGLARSASTAIYFLLQAHEFSAFHRVSSDEHWHHYAGDPLELHVLQGAERTKFVLGSDFVRGERPLAVVPANAWQAARPLAGKHGYTLCGCTVAPGFDFADFELPGRQELLALLPAHADLIQSFTR